MPLYALFIIVVCSVVIAGWARRRGWNAPLVVLAVALAIAWIPALPHYEVESEILLGVVLPPLLYSAALSSSYQDLRASTKQIINLGVGAVVVSALAVALVVWLLLPHLPFSAALVLGAVVAPPDAVAAASIAKKLGLPRRITAVLTGESLINDATSLTLYKVALASVFAASGSMSAGVRVFGTAVVAGVGIGLAVGGLAHLLRRWFDDPAVETVIGLSVPFVAYWLAEEFHGSGVLAVVAAGILIARLAPKASYSTRLFEEPLWASIDLVLECFTFALIGLQLPWVIKEVVVSRDSTQHAIVVSLAVLAVTLLVRPLYIFGTKFLGTIRMPWERSRAPAELNTKDLTIVSWAGMRGVVTLAAASAIPSVINGHVFPQRPTLQLAAYVVAIGTLLLQGLTLPLIIRRLGVDNVDEAAEDAAEEKRVRRLTAQSAADTVKAATADWAARMGHPTAQMAAEEVAAALALRSRAAMTLMSNASEQRAAMEATAAVPARVVQDGELELRQPELEVERALEAERELQSHPELAGQQELELDRTNGSTRRKGPEPAASADAAPQPASADAAPHPEAGPAPQPAPARASADAEPHLDAGPAPEPQPAPAPELAQARVPADATAQPGSASGAAEPFVPPGAEGAAGQLVPRRRHGKWRLTAKSAAEFADASKRMNRLRADIIRGQREVIVAERNAGNLNETVMRLMLRELDLEEESLAASWTNRL